MSTTPLDGHLQNRKASLPFNRKFQQNQQPITIQISEVKGLFAPLIKEQTTFTIKRNSKYAEKQAKQDQYQAWYKVNGFSQE